VVDGRKMPSGPQLAEMFKEAHQALHDLEHGAKVDVLENGKTKKKTTPNFSQTFDLCVSATKLGWKGSTRPGGQPESIVDDQGDAMPPIGDPTGELVVSDHRISDPIRKEASIMYQGFTSALGDLRASRSALIRASQFGDTEKAPDGCSNHERIGVYVEAETLGRCRWCYRFFHIEHFDAPTEFLELRDSGRKITQGMIDLARPSKSKGKAKMRAGK
jgi:hypothetical protein